MIPLSGNGAFWGADATVAIPLLEEIINAEQNRFKFKFLVEDGRCGEGNSAIAAAKKLVSFEGAHFIVAGCSGEVLQIGHFVEHEKVLTVCFLCGSSEIKKLGSYVFRTYLDFSGGPKLIVEEARRKQLTPVAILTEENSFTAALKQQLQELLGKDLGFADNIAPGESDLATFILKARAAQPRSYYLNAMDPRSFINMYQQLRKLGIKDQVFGYYVPGLKEVKEALGSALSGTIYFDVPNDFEKNLRFDSFMQSFNQKKPEGPSSAFTLRTLYNAFTVITSGISDQGPDATSVRDFLSRYDAPSPIGRLRFDANGDVVDLNWVLRVAP